MASAAERGLSIPDTTRVNVPLNKLAPEWVFKDENGNPLPEGSPIEKAASFGRRDGGFRTLKGAIAIANTLKKGEDTKSEYGFPYFEQTPDPNDPEGSVGVGVLFFDKDKGSILVHHRPDALGTPLGLTIQASYTNLQTRKVPFAEFVSDPLKYDFLQQADPQCIHGPVRFGIEFVEKEKIDLTGIEGEYKWITLEKLADMTLNNKISANSFFDTGLKLLTATLSKEIQKQETQKPQKIVSKKQSRWERVKHWFKMAF